MKIIVFDTETTGLPDKNASLDQQPYICQFAAITYELINNGHSLEEIDTIDILIKPGETIPFECTEVHGITNAMVADKGNFNSHSAKIRNAFNHADIAVAHNLNFDKTLLEFEFERAGESILFLPDQTFDTMKETRDLCKLPGKKAGTYKSPRLMELHKFLFNVGFDDAHNALNDVRATGKCLEELIRRGIYTPEAKAQASLF